MFFNQTDLENEIRQLNIQLNGKRHSLDKGLKTDMSSDELKKLYREIKDLSKHQELLFEESNMQRNF